MIKSFKDKTTAATFTGLPAKKLPADIRKRAREKLDMVNAAVTIDDLRSPPANRLEAKKGSRKGQHCIRINDQWRVCFVWNNGDAFDVQIIDYH